MAEKAELAASRRPSVREAFKGMHGCVEHSVTSASYLFLLLLLLHSCLPRSAHPVITLQRPDEWNGVVELLRARRRNWKNKGVEVWSWSAGEPVSISSLFEFKVNRPQRVPSPSPSSFPSGGISFSSRLFFFVCHWLSGPQFCLSLWFPLIPGPVCLAPFASLLSLLAHNYMVLFSPLFPARKSKERKPKKKQAVKNYCKLQTNNTK